MKSFFRWLCFVAWLPWMPLHAKDIQWFSDPNKTNLDSTGAAMDSGFHFELGVFSGGFVPTALNVDQWATYWVFADTTTYEVSNQRFARVHGVSDNTAPFVAGTKGWIMGFRDTASGSQRILFRNNAWLWPVPDPLSPFLLDWNTKDANEIVLGAVNPSGAPFLMQSAAFQTYAQWKMERLTGEPLGGPNDDPDRDGTPNLLEFVFGTSPSLATMPPSTPSSFVTISGQSYLQISIPRLRNRLATFTVEVSSDLNQWTSGDAYTAEVANTAEVLVVRDKTASGAGLPQRFMRLKAVVQP